MANARLSGFLRGFGGMFEFVNVLNRRLLAESAAEAEAEALREVWEEVGGYLYEAMGAYSSADWHLRRREWLAKRNSCQTKVSDK